MDARTRRILRVVNGENNRADYYASGLFVHHADGRHRDLATSSGSALPSGEPSIFPFVAVSCGEDGSIVVAGHDWGGRSSAFAVGTVPLTGDDYAWRQTPRLRGPLVAHVWAIARGSILAADVAGGIHVLAPGASEWTAAYVDAKGRGALALATDGGDRLWMVGRSGLMVASADSACTWRLVDRRTTRDDLTCVTCVGWACGEVIAAGPHGRIVRVAAAS